VNILKISMKKNLFDIKVIYFKTIAIVLNNFLFISIIYELYIFLH